MTKRNLYKTGIELAEGTTTIRAVAVNEKGIAGEIKSYTYHLEIPLPDTPGIRLYPENTPLRQNLRFH